ncbi:hypothetical protein [uncultured Porphyromonas sp.]|uniref:hypothetical protein n=1 Tax=uncultured Porphyromonas sp. TaxID=159274 RepID=UPI00260BAC4D|nr:hypothetical protein [uncultured Porphyromonas sp.]
MKKLLLFGASSLLFAFTSSGASSMGNTIKVTTSCGEETWLYEYPGTDMGQVMEDIQAIEEFLCGGNQVEGKS